MNRNWLVTSRTKTHKFWCMRALVKSAASFWAQENRKEEETRSLTNCRVHNFISERSKNKILFSMKSAWFATRSSAKTLSEESNCWAGSCRRAYRAAQHVFSQTTYATETQSIQYLQRPKVDYTYLDESKFRCRMGILATIKHALGKKHTDADVSFIWCLTWFWFTFLCGKM